MRKSWRNLAVGSAILVALMILGCSNLGGPDTQTAVSGVTTTSTVVSQDLAQLSVAGVTTDATTGVFSIGWKKFVGPDITQMGTVGEAYAVVQTDTSATTVRSGGIDIGTVTLVYYGGSTELTKRTTRDSSVLYETFSKGMHLSEGIPVNIPFVSNGYYAFSVSGSSAFTAGMFQVTAPPSLLSISGHADGDTVSQSADLSIQWTGGLPSDSVLVRIVPHLRPSQLAARQGNPDSLGGKGGKCGGPKSHRQGPFAMGGPMERVGPEFAKEIVVTVPNTGAYTLSAADLLTLLSGTEAAELMIGVTQVVKKQLAHDSGTVTVVLRNGDRIVLHTK